MNQVNPYTYTKGVKDNLNMGGYDGVGGQGSSALVTKGTRYRNF